MHVRDRGIKRLWLVLWFGTAGFVSAQQAPTINSGGIVNPGNGAGNFPPDPITAGSILSIYGTNLGPPEGVAAPGSPLPVILAQTQVLINGIAAPLFDAADGVVNAQVPWELAGASSVTVQVAVNGLLSNSVTVPLGIGPGIIATLHADGSYITSSNPAVPNEVLTISCTGLGPVTNQPADGAAALDNPLSSTTSNPTVTIGGIPALVSSSGLTPGFAGLYQVTVQVPSNVTSGYSAVVLSAGIAFAGWDDIPVQASSSLLTVSSTVPGNLAFLRAGGGATGTFQYNATVTGADNNDVLWSVNGIPGGNTTVGTISSNGLYTSPSAVPNPNTVTIGVVSAADPTQGDSGTVTLYGPAATLSASSLSMGVVAIGSSVTQSVTLTNSGGDDLVIDRGSFPGANGRDFPVSMFSWGNCTTPLAVGLSCTFSISFAPSAAGVRSAAFQLNTSDPDGPQFINLTGIGAAPGSATTTAAVSAATCGSLFVSLGSCGLLLAKSPNILNFGPVPLSSASAAQTVRLTNTGGVPLDITSLTVGGLNATDFAISDVTCPQDPATLAPGANCSISVVFAPSLASAESASLTFSGNTSAGTQTITLAGSGGLQPALSLSSTLLNYGAAPAGTSAPQTVTLINTGPTRFYSITGVSIAGPNAADFTISSNTCPLSPFSLPIGFSCAITVAAKPSTSGTEAAIVQISIDPSSLGVDAPAQPKQELPSSFFSIPAAIIPRGALLPAISLPSVSRWVVPFGTTVQQTITVRVGPVAVYVGSIATVGANFVIASGGNCPGTQNNPGFLPPNQSCNVLVNVTQSIDQTQLGALVVVSSAGTRQTILISSGAGPFVLGVLTAGLGSGEVAIDPALPGQSPCLTPSFQSPKTCPPIAYAAGTWVNLTATPIPDNAPFGGWSDPTGFCGGLHNGKVCGPFLMDEDKLILATFPLARTVLVATPPGPFLFTVRNLTVTPASIVLRLTEQHGLPVAFRVTPSVPWGVANPSVGVAPATVTLSVNPQTLPAGPGDFPFVFHLAGGMTFNHLTGFSSVRNPHESALMDASFVEPAIVTGTLTVESPPSQFTLTVGSAGTGTGVVSLSPPGAIYASGTVVTLTATPNTDSTFAGWSGACSGTGTCTVTMNSNLTVTATFNLVTAHQFTLTTTTSGTGSGKISASPAGTSCGSACLSFAAGTAVTLTAIPNSGSTFAGWSGACSGTGICTLTVTANVTINAAFNLQTATVTLSGVTLSTGSLVGGNSATGTVTLSGPAGTGGVFVSLQSNSASVAVPASVTVPVGQTSANFAVTTSVVTAQTSATISASLNGTVRTAALTLTPAPAGGGPLTGTWLGTWTDTEPGPQFSCALSTTLTWNLTQTGTSVTGTYTVLVTAGAPANFCSSSVGQRITGNFVQGSASGSSVTLTADANLNGFVFSGTLAGATISGTGGNANEGGPFSVTHQ